MAYKRDDAVNHADTHWNIPCDDGKFGLTNDRPTIAAKRRELHAPAADGWQPLFVDDGAHAEKLVFRRTVGGVVEEKVINGWAGLADCAHFLSQCLSAGGVTVEEWGVPGLVSTLMSRADTKTLCERVPQDRTQRVIDTGIFKKGDMIGYFNVSSSGDYGGRPEYSHSTMFVNGRVTCHTVCRFPSRSWVEDRWWLHAGNYTYTLIHFIADDPAPELRRTAALEGWWRLTYSARTEYYYIFKDGRARYTRNTPKSAKDQMHAVDGHAYWFMESAGKVTFIWRATGTVEVWSPSPGSDLRAYSSLINGATPGVVARLF